MNLSKLLFISILAATAVATDTTGGLRSKSILTPSEESVIALSDDDPTYCVDLEAPCYDDSPECCGERVITPRFSWHVLASALILCFLADHYRRFGITLVCRNGRCTPRDGYPPSQS